MKHDFTGKSIKCETWEQMLHLAKLAEEQGYERWLTSEDRFNNGEVYFTVDHHQYMCISECFDEIETTYSEFTNPPLPTEVVEVTGCVDCPMYTKLVQYDYQYCAYPNKQQSCQMHVDMFANCPLKKASITLQLKQHDTTGN